jgi:hypothetical protein
MTNKTSGRLLLAAALVGTGLYFAPTALDEIGELISNVAGAPDAVVVGEGDNALMITVEVRTQVAVCTPETIVAEKRCGDLRVLIVDASRMPFIARNTKLAWEEDLPAVLTMNRAKQDANRNAACPERLKKSFKHGGSCDEYPMATTAEGGATARAEEVPPRENGCQGGSYVRQYPPDGERFLVVISHPDLVATGPYTGTDIAKEQGRC